MDVSIEVLGVSDGEVPSYDEYDTYPTGQRLHCRVVFAKGSSVRQCFDNVLVTLQGELHSKIGTKAAVEKLLSLCQVRQRSHFEQGFSLKEASAPSIHTEVTFDLPEIIPSLNLAGTTSVTRSSTLADRHYISGQCSVRYWLQAEFRSKNLLIRRLTCPVDFSKLMKPAHMTVLASSRASLSRRPVRVQRRGFSFRRELHLLSAMTLEVPHELGVVASTPKTSGAAHQRLSIPLTFSVPQISGSSIVLSEGIQNVSIQANWHTTKSFGTSRLVAGDYNTGSVIRKGTVVRQRRDVSFPPFFEDKTIDQSLYSSTTCMDLILPETISDSSINLGLVSIAYELELEAAFDVKMPNGRSVRCRSNMRIPLQVVMT